MRRDPQPAVALGQRRAHAKQAPAFQHGKVAMDQPRRGRRRRGAKVILLQQNDPQAASRGIARNADAVQPATDDGNVVIRHAATISCDLVAPWQLKPAKPSQPGRWRKSGNIDAREPASYGAAAATAMVRATLSANLYPPVSTNPSSARPPHTP